MHSVVSDAHAEPAVTMAPQHFLLFGDQTVELVPSLKRLLELSKASHTVRQFLQSSLDVVQRRLSALNADEKARLGSFDSFEAVLDAYSQHEDTIGVAHTVAICVCRLAELILNVQNDPSLLGAPQSRVIAIGLCTGLLPAAALAGSRNISELISTSVETVAVCFRLALELYRRTRRIEEAPGHWAYTVLGLRASETNAILDDFHLAQNTPNHRRVFIGVQEDSWLTLFGPPPELAQLFSYSSRIEAAPKTRLAAYGAVHASHLPVPDIDEVVGNSAVLDRALTSHVQVLSTSTGEPYTPSTLRELYVDVCREIVQKRLKLTDVLASAVSKLNPSVPVQVTVVGLTNATPIVKRTLEERGLSVELQDKPQAQSPQNNDSRAGSNSIAIVGMAGRFPGSDDLEEFWQSLLQGLDAHQEIPSDRFDIESYFDSTNRSKNSIATRYGCFLRNPGHFDHRLFNVSPREAEQMSPLQRLLLMSSYEALQMAGYTSNGTLATEDRRVATYFGQAADDWKDVSRISGIDLYYVPGLQRGFTPGRLNYHYKWEGASYCVDSACASSASAIGLACAALLARDCDTALAGGVNSLTSPEPYSGLTKGSFLSSTGACKTFQDAADGYCRGEAVGVVVLKRLEDALHDNDNVLAVIRGQGRNHSANASSITHPHAETQTRLYTQVLQRAGVQANEIGFVEMHGTGTQAGDAVEMSSVLDIFGQNRTRSNPLILGAVKANIGHTEAAAGVVSIIKSVLALQRGVIPPQPGAPFTINRNFLPLKEMNVRIAEGAVNFHKPSTGNGKKKVMVNNFDAAGGNSCFIIEEAPEQTVKETDSRSHHAVVVSARTSFSLKKNQEALLGYLTAHPDTRLSDLAYSTTARRIHEDLRAAYSADSVQSICAQLQDDISRSSVPAGRFHKKSLVWVFSGQGSQYPGMGWELFHQNATFRRSILSMQAICDLQGLPAFAEIVSNKEVDLSRQSATQVQLATVAIEIALAELWQSWGVKPDLVIGHSLGEYAALCVAGVLSVNDTLFLVGERALMTERKCEAHAYAMLAVAASAQAVEEWLVKSSAGSTPPCSISCYNAPSATVVSGPAGDIQVLEKSLRAAGTVCTLVRAPYGFHSAQLDPILDEFETRARSVRFHRPQTPVISTAMATVVREAGIFSSHYLARQAREPVLFHRALEVSRSEGVVDANTVWLELGPDALCGPMVRATLETKNVFSTLKSREPNWKTISAAVAALYTSRLDVNWPAFHSEYTSALKLLDLPKYAFDTKNFWRVYKEEPVVDSGPVVVQSSAVRPISSSLHFVKKEVVSADEVSVTFETLLSDASLYEAICGHLVDGLPLCPSSIFSDMALTAAQYVFSKSSTKTKTGETPRLVIESLSLEHPVVVATAASKQTLHISAILQKIRQGSPSVEIKFHLHDPSSSVQEIGHGRVATYTASEWTNQWSNMSFFIKSRLDSLVQSVTAGNGHHLRRAVIYKLFAGLVNYDPKYQGIDEVFWDERTNDAVANITLKAYQGAGEFLYLPYWTDALVHLSGFVLNVDMVGSGDTVYLSSGLKKMQVYGELVPGKKYTTYVRTHETDEHGMVLSDVYVFAQGDLVAFCSLVFQKMARSVLHHILHRGDVKSRSVPAEQRVKSEISQAAPLTSIPLPEAAAAAGPKVEREVEVEVPNLADQVIAFVAEETGVELGDMEPSADFGAMGVDSLMSITLIDRIKKETGVQLEASFFQDNPTVADAIKALAQDSTSESEYEGEDNTPGGSWSSVSPPESDVEELQSVAVDVKAVDVKIPLTVTELKTVTETVTEITEPPTTVPAEYTSNVVLIHGRKKSSLTPLFLITDGAGSATAYLHLPRFPSGMPLYAVESPFVRCPLEYNFSVEQTAQMYIAAIKRIQPTGPYLLGGWSAGGAHAFEVSRQLLEAGEAVDRLIIIDMKIPKPMPEGLEVTMDFLDKVGLTTGINRAGPALAGMSERLKQHLAHTIKSLMVYTARAMDPARRPGKSVLIWAEYGLAEIIGDAAFKDVASMMGLKEDEGEGVNVMEDDTGLGSWFYSRRDNFGPNGWDRLLGDVQCRSMKADHFSMVTPPCAARLGELLQEAVN